MLFRSSNFIECFNLPLYLIKWASTSSLFIQVSSSNSIIFLSRLCSLLSPANASMRTHHFHLFDIELNYILHVLISCSSILFVNKTTGFEHRVGSNKLNWNWNFSTHTQNLRIFWCVSKRMVQRIKRKHVNKRQMMANLFRAVSFAPSSIYVKMIKK